MKYRSKSPNLLPILIFLFIIFLNFVEARPKWGSKKRFSFGSRKRNSEPSGPTCGYDSCAKTEPNLINVHLVAHTHDDVGWLKTVDQYYYGSRSGIQKAGVQYILDSVVASLLQDPKKKFIYVESAFFFKWWREQSEEMQDKVKMLVSEGRLEFIGGAWSMNDEATTHYQSIIDQFTWGLRRLNDTFGECGRPRVGWQIDPFGHSREMASLFAQMSYDGYFFGRLHYPDKEERLKNKEMEFIWKGSDNLGEAAELFTGALYNTYSPPRGFCWDILCDDEPFVDNKHSKDYNVDRLLNHFFAYLDNQILFYRTNHIILTMGGDFTYQDANYYYKNLDKLIRSYWHSIILQSLSSYLPSSTKYSLLYTQLNHFFEYANNVSRGYQSNNILITMGEDFHYQDANMWYKNLDKLIKYGNERQSQGSKYNFIYSTPSCYLKSLKESNQTWPTKTGDFFPYASDPTAVWTGYFTSRPTVKRYERMGNHFLQICKQLTSIASLKNFAKTLDSTGGKSLDAHLTFMREQMGVMQHHDAVTGTEKQHVADDYMRRTFIALKACNYNVKLILNELSKPTTDEFHIVPPTLKEEKINSRDVHAAVPEDSNKFEFQSCHLLNISQCSISDSNDKFMVTVYNPLAHSTFQPVRIPVRHSNYQVRDYRKVPVEIQIVPINQRTKEIPYRNSPAIFEIVFLAQEIPALGYKSYFVEVVKDSIPLKDQPIVILLQNDGPEDKITWGTTTAEEVIIGNRNVQAKFDVETGRLTTVAIDGETHKVSQEFFYYNGASGNNEVYANRSSGAYIFRPNGTENYLRQPVQLQVVKGDVVDEVFQKFNDWITQVVRIYHDNTTTVEFEWTVGPIPIEDAIGKEIVSRFTTEIQSKGVFATDSNGREMLKRVRNNQALFSQETVALNYYPLNTKIFIEDDNSRLAILTDRAQGATSLKDGNIDVMVHRRLLRDDAFGVGEALNETQFGHGLIATGKLSLLINSQKASPAPAAQERFLQNRILLPNWMFFSTLNDTYDEWLSKYKNIGSHLTLALPQNVYLMTLEPWRENSYLVRFEHLLEKDEDANYSKQVTFDLIDVFGKLFDIESVVETNLAANQFLSDVKRFKFTAKSDAENTVLKRIERENLINVRLVDPIANSEEGLLKDDDSLKYSITLNPMQIRTFVIKVNEEI